MSEITWESLRPELQTALRTLAEGRRIDSALENELEDLGLAEYVQGAHATWATDAGRALLPAGEAVDVPTPLCAICHNEPAVVDVLCAVCSFHKMKDIEQELAAALARAQAAEGEVKKLRAALMGIGFDASFALGSGDPAILQPALERIEELADNATE